MSPTAIRYRYRPRPQRKDCRLHDCIGTDEESTPALQRRHEEETTPAQQNYGYHAESSEADRKSEPNHSEHGYREWVENEAR